MSMRTRGLIGLFVTLFATVYILTEEGILGLQLVDPQGRAIAGAQLTTTGDSTTSSPSDGSGKVRIRLAPDTKPSSWVSLFVARSPQGRDLVLISPWDSRVMVPSFSNDSANMVRVVLADRGDRQILESGTAIASIVARITGQMAPSAVTHGDTESSRQAALNTIASYYGLPPTHVDAAIRAWAERQDSSFDNGLAALYLRQYPRAERELSSALHTQEQQLDAARSRLADTALVLGQSLYAQGKYGESIKNFRRASTERKDHVPTLVWLGSALAENGDYAAAERTLLAARALVKPGDSIESLILRSLAATYYYQSKYTEAETLLKQGLHSGDSSNPVDEAHSLTNLSMLYSRTGKYSEAVVLATRALEVLKDKGAALDESAAWHALGTALEELARYHEAEDAFLQALMISEKCLSAGHPDLAFRLSALAGLYQSTGRYDEARGLYERAMEIASTALGSRHPYLATIQNNMAEGFRRQGNYSTARTLYDKALEISREAYGSDHESVGAILNNIGLLLRSTGKFLEAEDFYKRSLDIRRRVFGPYHSEVATSLGNLAVLKLTLGQDVEALKLAEESLAINERALGPDHPALGEVLNTLASIHEGRGRVSEAEAELKRCLTIQQRALGGAHQAVALTLNNLGELYREHGRASDAVPLYEQAIVIFNASGAGGHPSMAAFYNNIGLAQLSMGKSGPAEAAFLKAISIDEHALGPDSYELIQELANLASVYCRTGRVEPGLVAFNRALSIAEKRLGAKHPSVATVLEMYADSLRYLRRTTEAEMYERRARSIRAAEASEE
jgi:tetratricopeptide (TPR) repeat protein